ncbi:MAG: prepilin-type N-terminal cleavage/methylation domain-containing protein [Candidatus Sungbacteria bacterium]|nr:prepilin-type N-terminal cleavage/methylation domain-containing protein [Candidatus Sungbacteria bacterium]
MRYHKGFTLIELLVVISIISLLASVVLASLNSARAKARDARRISDLKQLSTALEFYYDANNAYPSVSAEWALNRSDYITQWNELKPKMSPYIPTLPVDPLNTYPPSDSPGNFTYHYNNTRWYDGAYHAWLGGANQGYALLAWSETGSLGAGAGCWSGWFTVCVK